MTGIIDAFSSAGVHTAELPGLQAVLLDCQYADGAFSDQYGASAEIDRDRQTSGYALMSLVNHLPSTPATQDAANRGGVWLAATQDVSGGWVYSSGEHLPEIGGEAACGAAMSWAAAGATVTAAPGHEKVTLDWTMADASDVDHYEIWRAVWNLGAGFETTSAYPEYDDDNPLEPVWPTDHAAANASLEWQMIDDTVVGTATGYVDDYAPRGIYYYEVYAVDAVGYVGPGAGPRNRATNYWLGDIDPPTVYDGDVDIPDIDELAATFGYGPADGGYNNEADVGPTDDLSGFGIPTTDSVIDFEDLMVFAMNYSNVAPRQPEGSTLAAVLAWTRLDEGTWALELVEPCADLKGLRLRASLPQGTACEASAGELLDAQASPAFVANIDRHGLDVSLALMGRGCSIVGAGELLRVTCSGDAEIQPEITARGADNGDVRVAMATGAEPLTPGRFVAAQNYPNPFNPKTTIAFELPDARRIRLGIYALDGSLVRTLVDGELPPGAHEVVWDGLDAARQRVATGTYFYRLDAGPDREIRKMTLMK